MMPAKGDRPRRPLRRVRIVTAASFVQLYGRHGFPRSKAMAAGPNGIALKSGAKVPVLQEHCLLAVGDRPGDRGGEGEASMLRRPAVFATRAARAVRGLWPDRNPLRRTMDRVEAIVAGGLVVAFLAGAPLAAVAASHAVYSTASRNAHSEQASWRQVSAVLTATAPPAGFGQIQVTVPARWTAPDGTRHTGNVPAPAGTKAGQTVMVWVDAAGRVTGQPPLQMSQVRGQAALATVITPLAVGFILLGAGLLVHAVLGRRRLAAWDTDWQITEPQWTWGR